MEQSLRTGFTTGTCATAAAKAAAWLLLSGQEPDELTVVTPRGTVYAAKPFDFASDGTCASCAVKKDAGDDPDVTNGIDIYAMVRKVEAGTAGLDGGTGSDAPGQPEYVGQKGCAAGSEAVVYRRQEDTQHLVSVHGHIVLDGGEGIGRVTLPGLDQPVGAAAINSVPRRMIAEAVAEVCAQWDYQGALSVTIYAPQGRTVANRTLNTKYGVEGGISVLGTSGIVEPMSTDALLAALRVQIHQKRVLGDTCLALAVGNYGRQLMADLYGYELSDFVKCANYIGNAVRMAADEGFSELLLVGHIGKLAKVAGGALNTHSRYGDCRMEQLAAAAIACGGTAATVRGVLSAVTTEEGLRRIAEAGLLDTVGVWLHERIEGNVQRAAGASMRVSVIVFSKDFGVLG